MWSIYEIIHIWSAGVVESEEMIIAVNFQLKRLERVPYTFFVTREWAFLLCVKREWGFIFSVIRESIFFRPRETGFLLFRDPWNMHLLSRDFWTNDFCGNNFSIFLEILASLKLVTDYTKLDAKLAHSMSSRTGDWELTTATANLRA